MLLQTVLIKLRFLFSFRCFLFSFQRKRDLSVHNEESQWILSLVSRNFIQLGDYCSNKNVIDDSFLRQWFDIALQVILTCVPFTFTVYIVDSWPFGLVLCKVSECAKDISIGVSVFTLTALSADRFFAIVDPMRKLHASGTSFDFPFSHHSEIEIFAMKSKSTENVRKLKRLFYLF